MKKSIQFLIIAILFSAVACTHYSNGVRTGYLLKFSNKGFAFKTWEGQMNLGGLKEISDKSGTSYVANTWDFSLDGGAHNGENIQALADTLNLAVELGYRIKVHYNQEAFTNCFCQRGNENYFVDKVEIIR